ncbi:hypothetical protein DXG01_016801 [Tephrocybe rancida]|nr:hypothetical protein DXG01_016801 [Tephrocybe rancida]
MPTIEVMYISVRRSQHALLAIGFFVMMILTVFSTLLGTWDPILDTFINSDGDPSQFSSIPAAAWFVLVTITTVGYGEITPRSFLGRLITLPILMFGLLLITLPSFVLGREFSHVWEQMSARQNERSSSPNGHALDPGDSPLAAGFPSMSFLPLRSAYPQGQGHGTATPPMDLTNRKLAQNQTELSMQIAELRAAVERQGEVVLGILEVIKRGHVGASGDEGKGKAVERP